MNARKREVARLPAMQDEELSAFERFLALPDPLLTQWFSSGATGGGRRRVCRIDRGAARASRIGAGCGRRRFGDKMTARPRARRSHRAHHRRRAGRARRAGARAARQRGAIRRHARRAAARRARRPADGAAGAGAVVLRAAGAGHHVSGLGHGAVRPRRPRLRHRRPPHGDARQAGAGDAQAPDHRADDRQRHRAAGAGAQLHEAHHQGLGARAAHRHGTPDAAPGADGLYALAARSWSRASTPCAAASSIFYPPGRSSPVRLDFFGDTLETIKAFDVTTQRTTKPVQKLALMPVSEVAFGEEAEKLFRTRYVELFGGNTGDDPLYEAVSTGHRYPGQEHWLPLFHDHLETLFDYLPGVPVSFDHRSDESAKSRFEQIAEHYEARNEALEEHKFGGPPYKPVPPERMFLDAKSFAAAQADRPLVPADAVRGRRRPQRALLARARRAHLRRRAPAGRRQRVRRRRRPHPPPAGRAAPRHRHGVDARRARAPGDAALRPRPQGRDARRILRRGAGAARHGDRHRRARPRAGLRDAGDRRHRRAGHPRRPPRAPAPQAAHQPSTC